MRSTKAALALCAMAWSARAWAAEPPTAAAFGALPAVSDVALSPDGRHVALAAEAEGKSFVSIVAIDQPQAPKLALGEVEIEDLEWLSNDYALVSVSFWMDAWSNSLVKVKAARLYRTLAVTAEGRLASTLLKDDDAVQAKLRQLPIGATKGPPAKAYMVGLAGKAPKFYEPVLWRVDPATGQGELAERGGPATVSWGFDEAGEPRIRIDRIAGGDFTVSYREKAATEWKVVWTSKGADDRRSYHGYAAPEDALIFSRKTPDGYQLVLRGLHGEAERPVGKPHILQPSMLWDGLRQTISAVVDYPDKPAYDWVEPEPAAAHATLSRVFKGMTVQLPGWSADHQRFLVRLGGPDTPTSWRLYDKATRQVSLLADTYPQLNGAALGATRWMTYKARDGLSLGAYVTTPPGAAGARPLVVLPHDGPRGRDGDGFDYLTQFLATRGYVVLRPQYRGSNDWAPALEAAGDGQWADGMQTDLLDAVAALAAEGAVDPKRVCIVGDTFGGYLALGGVAFHPEAYRCAASISGISDVAELIGNPGQADAAKVFSGWWAKQKRHPPEELARMSPSARAGAVKGAVLLIVAAQDGEIPVRQSEIMRDAMKSAKGAVEYKVIDGADHDFSSATARAQMLEALGAFLAKNLPTGP